MSTRQLPPAPEAEIVAAMRAIPRLIAREILPDDENRIAVDQASLEQAVVADGHTLHAFMHAAVRHIDAERLLHWESDDGESPATIEAMPALWEWYAEIPSAGDDGQDTSRNANESERTPDDNGDTRSKRPCYVRDHLFLCWKNEGMTPAVIRDRWNDEHPSEPVGKGEAGRDVVKKGIDSALRDLAEETGET